MAHPGVMVNFRMSPELHDLVMLELRRHNATTSGEVIGLSAWLRSAVNEKLNHLRRGRKGERARKYRCNSCGMSRRIEEIDHFIKPMWGKKEYACIDCVRVTVANGQIHPLNDQGNSHEESA